jgi:hypothetical protein
MIILTLFDCKRWTLLRMIGDITSQAKTQTTQFETIECF